MRVPVGRSVVGRPGTSQFLPHEAMTMSEAPATSSPLAEGPGLSLPARVWGILTSPRETFADVVARPRWFGMMALVLLVTAVCTGGFFSTEVGQTGLAGPGRRAGQRWRARRCPRRSGPAMEKMAPYMGLIYAGSTLLLAPLIWLIISGHALRGVQRGAGRRRDVQAAVRRLRALDGDHGRPAAVRHAAELRPRVDVERHEPGGLPADARRGRASWRSSWARSTCS